MRDYGKIETRFWGWAKAKRLSDHARTLALYLLSGPHSNNIGVFELPLGYVVEDLRWDSETVSKGFAELFRNRFAYRCEKTDFVFVRDFLHHNPPENANVAKAMAKSIEQISDDFSYWLEFKEVLEPYTERFRKGFINGLPNGLPNGMPTPEPSQTKPEPEPEPRKKQASASASPSAAPLLATAEPPPADPPKPPVTKRRTQIPDGWQPDDNGLKFALDRGFSLLDAERMAAQFRDHHRAKGTVFADISAGWRTWVQRQLDFNGRTPPGGKPGGGKPGNGFVELARELAEGGSA